MDRSLAAWHDFRHRYYWHHRRCRNYWECRYWLRYTPIFHVDSSWRHHHNNSNTAKKSKKKWNFLQNHGNDGETSTDRYQIWEDPTWRVQTRVDRINDGDRTTSANNAVISLGGCSDHSSLNHHWHPILAIDSNPTSVDRDIPSRYHNTHNLSFDCRCPNNYHTPIPNWWSCRVWRVSILLSIRAKNPIQ